MPHIPSFEWEARKEGVLAGIELGLKLKFGAEGLQLLPELHQVSNVEVLWSVLKAIETASSVDELRRMVSG